MNEKITAELQDAIYSALRTYSNVHRGSGHNSMVTTRLYEEAREAVADYLELKKGAYHVVFCTPRRAEILTALLKPGSYKCLSSNEIGLSTGIRAIAIEKRALPGGAPFQSGGGTTRLISKEWIIWAKAPDRFEAGTPAVINSIAFATALKLMKQNGITTLSDPDDKGLKADEILYHDHLEEFSGADLLSRLRGELIGKEVMVSTKEGDKPYINLDNAASTRTFGPVWESFRHSMMLTGTAGEEVIREVKSICSGFLNAPQDIYDIIFTSNTTEAINLAAESLSLESVGNETESVVLTTLLEHNSNDLPWRNSSGSSLHRISIDNDGLLDLDEMEKFLIEYNQEFKHGNKRIPLVAVCGASNVLGIMNDIEAIAKIVHRYGARLLVDGAQMLAHRKIEMEKEGIDLLAFSGHKAYAPFGSGALVARKGLLRFSPEQMESIRLSGEENVAGIAALGKSLHLLGRAGMELVHKEEQEITARALKGMGAIKGIRIYGIKDPSSPVFSRKAGVISFDFRNSIASAISRKLSEQGGIGTRSGCHCAHILVKHILGVKPPFEGIQAALVRLFPNMQLPGVARVSFGIENTEADIDRLIVELNNISKRKS